MDLLGVLGVLVLLGLGGFWGFCFGLRAAYRDVAGDLRAAAQLRRSLQPGYDERTWAITAELDRQADRFDLKSDSRRNRR